MRRNAPFDLEDQFLRGLIANLHPFVLRISGTGCENVVFGSAGNTTVPAAVSKLLRPNGGGTAPFNAAVADWDRVVGFAKATGGDMVVGLNLLLREWPEGGAHGCASAGSADCAWDPTNARTWLEHNRDTAAPVVGYELGTLRVTYSAEEGLASTVPSGRCVQTAAPPLHVLTLSASRGTRRPLSLLRK